MRATVTTDGRLDYPFLQDVSVEGMTLSRLQDTIAQRLLPYTGKVPVLVQRAERALVWVTVLGEVQAPGTYPVPMGSFFQTALTQAGGLTPRSDLRAIQLLRGQNEELVDLEAFFREGDAEALPRLQDGDVIVVPGWTREHRVRVLGAVRLPGWYEPEPGADVMDMILQAGGVQEGDLRRVQFIHNNGGNREVHELDVQEFLEEVQLDALPRVGGGDIIVVFPDPEPILTWRNLMGVLRDLYILLSAYIIARKL